jgi:sialidase-1
MHASALGGNDEAPSSIASMRSRDGGRVWGEHRIEVSPGPGDRNVYNPSLALLEDGELLFFYLKYHHLVWNEPLVSSGYLKRSRDGGRSWTEPTPLWDHGPYGSANHTLTRLSSGRLLKSVETMPVWGGYPAGVSRSGCFRSDDGGLQWEPPESWVELPLRGSMENHIAETPDGELVMAVRNQLGSVFLSRSSDGGVRWSKPQTSGLWASESMPSLSRIPASGDLLLIWNNAEFDPAFDHCGKRTPLTCAVSHDGGRSWEHRKNLEEDPGVEFSNLACAFTSAGTALITYFTSRMANPDPPGRLGREAMSLKGAIVEVGWLYG